MNLAGQVFEFRNARVSLVLRVIDDRGLLICLDVIGLVFEFQRTVRQFAVAIVEKRIDRSGIDQLLVLDIIYDLAIVTIKKHLDTRAVQYILEHTGVAMPRHRLELVGKISIVAVCSGRNPRRYRCVQLRWIQSPLFSRVATEEFFI